MDNSVLDRLRHQLDRRLRLTIPCSSRTRGDGGPLNFVDSSRLRSSSAESLTLVHDVVASRKLASIPAKTFSEQLRNEFERSLARAFRRATFVYKRNERSTCLPAGCDPAAVRIGHAYSSARPTSINVTDRSQPGMGRNLQVMTPSVNVVVE